MIHPLVIAAFVLLSILLTTAFSANQRWQALLVSSLVLYYTIVGTKLLVMLALALVIYSLSFKVKDHIHKLWWVVLLLLVPLLIAKSTEKGHHFIQYANYLIMPQKSWHWSWWFQIVGLSYFSFNGISYLIDIKRKYIAPEKNFFLLLLYLLYFPTVFSGPLHRAKYLFVQFRQVKITNASISHGLRLMLWGLFKQIVIAQRLYVLLQNLLASSISGGYYLLLGLVFFLYLYCNFSAFVDFFQGVSQLFNVRLKDNFNHRIYLASSRQTFWQGWHKTLNEWFRDYFFFVVVKYDKKRRYTNAILLLTFLLIAVWHGFNYSLVLWGIMNGLWIILEKKVPFGKWAYPKLRKATGVTYHLLLSSVLALVFISPDIPALIKQVLDTEAHFPWQTIASQKANLIIIILAFGMMDYHSGQAKKQRFDDYLQGKGLWYRWFTYFKLTLCILALGKGLIIDNYYIQF
ncbi:hypothetical protein [uncultured Microscilla sp.]|uniref:hypothetical protein n=1 Tax=uncultured Microscilla sp. TaxID=432653 RepID=UPI0026052AA6|nr:hypothetical protein [uncultured Microscilla sp.]